MKKNTLIIGGVLLGFITTSAICSCKTIPKGATAIKPFDSKKYLGKWYEIARFDYRFERNLDQVTAEYSLNHDQSIKVKNKGYNFKSKEWKQSIGKAKFVSSKNEGKLKVSFFGPFYSGYNVIAIDDDYKYALVAGKNLKYLWFLSREKTMPESIKEAYLEKAAELGYKVSKLIWVKQDI